MSIKTLYAREFRKVLENGRNFPCVFACNDENDEDAGEYVIKFKAGEEMSLFQSYAEYLCGHLALHLGIQCPEPVLVDIDPKLFLTIPATQPLHIMQAVKGSSGMNFANEYLYPIEPWEKETPLVGSLQSQAATIFAFDAFIQNSDRGFQSSKPNLLRKGDNIIVLDHELAFYFTRFQTIKPPFWKVSQEDWLYKHLFRSSLQKATPKLIGLK